VAQLGQLDPQGIPDSLVPAASFDQFDFSGDGATLAVLGEISRSLTRIRELLEKISSK